ncbi:MAG: MBL fold metallo-hydrolase [Myxococcota bacterium]|jgi:N-acyl-phosphatidylethanolamine-hydrolysing phospholipase D|nr:hypothetical protein [bacterium]MDP6074386.1 MBL fold metallo-hydrolase [Myxococcota bacterium]MDP6242005.1 MBL fold metallo-hydrolase [Myxococcota bacterium]MDP7073771.1 MBL fold metallo-hydrolase [Myxococcota bacterium]MDP7300102.1 MBL fold metallo-hydrolase [Myxococcota bacterium]
MRRGRCPSFTALFLLGATACTYPRDADIEPLREPAEVASLYAVHRDTSGLFFSPWMENPNTLWSVLRWYLFTQNPYDKKGPAHVPRVQNDGTTLASVARPPEITWVGHSTFAVHDGDDVFLTDPHFGARALVPERKTPPGIPIESVPDDAFAVVSHNHYDHLDAWTVETLPGSVTWYVPLGLADWFRERGRENAVELDWWETARRGRWKITCLPSQHWSLRIEQGKNESLWCSWLLESGSTTYYFAGDTGYFHGFEEFGRRFDEIDVAMLPVGAYEPRWFMRWQHMDPAEAYQAFLDLRARFLLPMHWGTFDLTDEPVDLPPGELARVVAARGTDDRVQSMAIGERWRVPERP